MKVVLPSLDLLLPQMDNQDSNVHQIETKLVLPLLQSLLFVFICIFAMTITCRCCLRLWLTSLPLVFFFHILWNSETPLVTIMMTKVNNNYTIKKHLEQYVILPAHTPLHIYPIVHNKTAHYAHPSFVMSLSSFEIPVGQEDSQPLHSLYEMCFALCQSAVLHTITKPGNFHVCMQNKS